MTIQDTSREAAEKIKGHAPTQRAFVLELIEASPDGLTDEQIGEALIAAGLATNTNSHRARRGELVESGDVADSGQRATKPNGRKAILWASAR
jgi:hypothetical protein